MYVVKTVELSPLHFKYDSRYQGLQLEASGGSQVWRFPNL